MTDSLPPRKKFSLDAGWLFHLGDINPPLRNAHIAAYMANKAGWSRGAAKGDYDDSDWRTVDLPHDWSIEGNFDPSNHLDNGFLPRGVAWYRRHFRLEESSRNKYLALQFGGVATHCTVYVNGHCLHRNFCGYTPFTIDITDIATFGDALNTIAVRVDATTIEGWWYEGAGIYRHVWLIEAHPVHIAPNGIFVHPVKTESAWQTRIEVTLENKSNTPCEFLHELRDPAGQLIATHQTTTPSTIIHIPNPALWSCDSPSLYTLHTTVLINAKPVDEQLTPFGYRTLRFDAEQGFFLNDTPLKLLGTCNHQDHAGVGVAVPDSIHEFRIRRLLEMGTNAYRCAHHPPAPELLDACDRLGMLVIDENRNFGSSPEHLSQLRAMILRDRNHPCVIAWSLCNEEAIQATPAGEAIARTMVDHVRKLDPSRPITAAVSGGVLGDVGIGEAIEVMGINYQIATYDAYHAKHPKKPLIAAETHSTLATRGVYETNSEKKYFDSRDTEKATWGETARATWKAVKERDFVTGFFAWTGFDYRGEPTPHEWPCVNSQFGMLDLCGFPKEAFYLHKAWFTREPFVHVLPHWNWEASRKIEVSIYTNGEDAELFLNGESLGKKTVDPIEMATWRVEFAPGELKAVAYRGGVVIASASAWTTGPAVQLGLELHPSFSDGKRDLPVTVFAVDAAGLRVPTANPFVQFSIAGQGRILGVGNGDPTCLEHNQAKSRTLFNGLAQVLVQLTQETAEIELTATAEGLKPATLWLASHAPARLEMPAAKPRRFITDWRMSPITKDRPDSAAAPSEQDMNTWERINPTDGPQKSWDHSTGYAIYRATFTAPKSLQSTGGHILIPNIYGSAEAYVNDIAAPITTLPTGFRSIVFLGSPTGSPKHTLALLIHSDRAPAGIAGPIELAE